MSTLLLQRAWSELAVRDNDGLSVSLLWSRETNRVKVAIVDTQLDERFEFRVPGSDALAAFHHPFAYAAMLGASSGGPRSLAPERSVV